MKNSNNLPIALVIGLCSHGLAMTRALRQCDIEVHAFEANPLLPGALTNSAKIHYVNSVKTDKLVNDLLAFRKKIPQERDIILFPTNDNNVKIIGHHVDMLSENFLLSWKSCAGDVLSLLLKTNIEQRCLEQNINYPQSFTLDSLENVGEAVIRFEFPVIIKPVHPQSSFKALKCDTPEALKSVAEKYQRDFPLLVQHWITGTDTDLYFGALFLDNGKVISRFTGNKLESYPKAMGQTTVAITSDHPEILPLTEKFFTGLNMSGPVSVEFKRDHLGRFWVIEPTVGRTDFWFGLCFDAGCNLLRNEYQLSAGLPYSDESEVKDTIWFDSERDITAYARNIIYSIPWFGKGYRTSFSYFKPYDTRPAKRAIKKTISRVSTSILSKIGLKIKKGKTVTEHVKIYSDITSLPIEATNLLKIAQAKNIFLGHAWYENFCQHVANLKGGVRFYCLLNNENETVAVLPMWLKKEKEFGLSVNRLSSLTNYYSPMFDLAYNEKVISKSAAFGQLLSVMKTEEDVWHMIDIFPITEDLKEALVFAAKEKHLLAFPYHMTKNYYQPITKSYLDYFKERPSIVKNTLKRKIKKLSKLDSWSIDIYSDLEDLDELLPIYHKIYHDSWKVDEPYPEFINGLVKLSATHGWLRIGLLKVNGSPIAVQFWLLANNTAFIYKLAYINDFQKYSPGSILTNYLLEHVIDVDKIDVIDYLTGSDSYKSDWMDHSRELFGVQIINYRSFSGGLLYLRNIFSDGRKKLLNIYSQNTDDKNVR